MSYTDDIDESNVEDRIVGEFMTRLHRSDVSFEFIELLECQLSANDFGGPDALIERVESELIDDGD